MSYKTDTEKHTNKHTNRQKNKFYKPDADRDTKVRVHEVESGAYVGAGHVSSFVAHSVVIDTAAIIRTPLAAPYWLPNSTAFFTTGREEGVRKE